LVRFALLAFFSPAKQLNTMAHKCFLSYNSADKTAVDDFCKTFSGSFIRRGLKMEDDIIDSNDTDYVMRRIRQLYLQDSTVTIVLIGKCTWARRFVDWEVQAFVTQQMATRMDW